MYELLHSDKDLPWGVRMNIALDVAKGFLDFSSFFFCSLMAHSRMIEIITRTHCSVAVPKDLHSNPFELLSEYQVYCSRGLWGTLVCSRL